MYSPVSYPLPFCVTHTPTHCPGSSLFSLIHFSILAPSLSLCLLLFLLSVMLTQVLHSPIPPSPPHIPSLCPTPLHCWVLWSICSITGHCTSLLAYSSASIQLSLLIIQIFVSHIFDAHLSLASFDLLAFAPLHLSLRSLCRDAKSNMHTVARVWLMRNNQENDS